MAQPCTYILTPLAIQDIWEISGSTLYAMTPYAFSVLQCCGYCEAATGGARFLLAKGL